MDSNVGLAIQCVGILLVTLLSLFMRGSIQNPSLRYWTIAWCCLSLSLVSLFVGFEIATDHRFFYTCYFLGEYLFGLMFIAGCRSYYGGRRLSGRHAAFLIPAIVLAGLLPFVSADFNDLFMVQAAVMSAMFAVSFWSLRDSRRRGASPGIRVMSAALLLLAVDFLHYVPVFGARKGLWGVTVPGSYLQYTSIVDLLLEILLGFGTMMVLMERVRSEVEQANSSLLQARDKLELLARMDPLTEALNRHAFHSLLSRNESGVEASTSGCVAVVDIDNLKPINDSLGHNAGDKAIRAVARALRSLVRADDMLFRWGGDEFLLLMFKLPQAEASRRLQTLNTILEANCESWTSISMKVTASHGVAGFESLTQLGQAIESADKAMYETRQRMREIARMAK